MCAEIKKYRLFSLPPTGETLKRTANAKFRYASPYRCLVVDTVEPVDAAEITDYEAAHITAQEWEWIFGVSAQIRDEQEKEYGDRLMAQQKEFLERFQSLLEKRKAEIAYGEGHPAARG